MWSLLSNADYITALAKLKALASSHTQRPQPETHFVVHSYARYPNAPRKPGKAKGTFVQEQLAIGQHGSNQVKTRLLFVSLSHSVLAICSHMACLIPMVQHAAASIHAVMWPATGHTNWFRTTWEAHRVLGQKCQESDKVVNVCANEN